MTTKLKMRAIGSIMVGVIFGLAMPLNPVGAGLLGGAIYLLFTSIEN